MSLDSFMCDNGLDELMPVSETAHWFHEQLLAALAGQSSALPIYRTVVGRFAPSVPGESAIVLNADLTNLHAARAEIVAGRWSFRDIGRWDNLSGLTVPESREAYFDCIAYRIKPHLTSRTFRMGLCLPFALETASGATVLRVAADSTLHAVLDGADPAHEMHAALRRAGVSPQGTIRVVSPSVAVLLSAEVLPRTSFGNTAALITDGGGQVAYFEQPNPRGELVAMIAVLGYPANLKAINTVCRMPEPHISFNLTTLGGLALLHARAACDSGCFTPGAARQLRSLKRLSTPALCTWLETYRPDPTMDEKVFHAIGCRLVEHIGRRLAASSASVLRRVTRHAPESVSFFLVHGVSFSNSRLLRENLLEELSSVNPKYSTRSWRLAQVGNDILVGTACAALQCVPSDLFSKTAADAV